MLKNTAYPAAKISKVCGIFNYIFMISSLLRVGTHFAIGKGIAIKFHSIKKGE